MRIQLKGKNKSTHHPINKKPHERNVLTYSILEDEEKETDIEYNTFLVYKILILTTNLIKHKITDFQLSYHIIIKQLREKKYTYSQIADYLNERNMKTIANKTWKNSAVHSLMKNVENHLRDVKNDKIKIYDMRLDFKESKK